MVVFGLCAHQPGVNWLPSVLALAVTAGVMGTSLRSEPVPARLLGFDAQTHFLPPYAILGIVLGIMGGLSHGGPGGLPRQELQGVHPNVLLAGLVGVTEELVFRGWLLGRALPLGTPAAVVIAAIAHAAYKTALFVWPPDTVRATFDLSGILVGTIEGGLVVGALRVASGSVVPAMLAHAAFDATVYAGLASPPWWVWR
jgi:membrane protease YdiL (CAAX protease family)